MSFVNQYVLHSELDDTCQHKQKTAKDYDSPRKPDG